MQETTYQPITGKTLAKFPDIVAAALLIKKAESRANAEFGFITEDTAKKIEAAIEKGEKALPAELTALEMWGNDLSPLLFATNAWIAKEASVDIEELTRFDSVAAFTETVESLVITERLKSAIEGNDKLFSALLAKGEEFKNDLRLTRSHMQEAAPGTWGEVFVGLADSISHAIKRIEANSDAFKVLLSGSVISGNLKAPHEYADRFVSEISTLAHESYGRPTGLSVESTTSYLMGSSRMMELAADLRILSMVYQRFVHGFFIYGSGPRAGIAEITLPTIAPGSTIMPGKINPSMAMLLEQACQHLEAVDQMATYSYNEYDFDESSQSAGAFLMVAEALELLGKAASLFVDKCLTGFKVQKENNLNHLENALSNAKVIGLLKGKAAEDKVLTLMEEKNLTVKEAAEESGLMTPVEAKALFNYELLANDGITLQTLKYYLAKSN